MKFLVSIFLCFSTFFVSAQDMVVQSNLKGLLSHQQSQIVDLLNAFSEDQMDWRPAEGVRSVREAFLHIASSNYFLASGMGIKTPDDVDMNAINNLTGKKNIEAALNKSFAFIIDKIGQIKSSDFEKEVDFGFAKMSMVSAMMLILEHVSEHKGQLIAYARSNGVVPPWSK